MKTMYYKTSNFIQHSGNVVDLGEFRRRLDLAQQDSLARQPEEVSEPVFRPVVLTMDEEARRRASLAVVFMTLAFVLWIVW